MLSCGVDWLHGCRFDYSYNTVRNSPPAFSECFYSYSAVTSCRHCTACGPHWTAEHIRAYIYVDCSAMDGSRLVKKGVSFVSCCTRNKNFKTIYTTATPSAKSVCSLFQRQVLVNQTTVLKTAECFCSYDNITV